MAFSVLEFNMFEPLRCGQSLLFKRWCQTASWSFLLLLSAGCSLEPAPLTDQQIEQIAIEDRQLIFQGQEDYEKPLTLEAAMALALKYNLENRVRMLEEAVANQQRDMSEIELLPSLAASAGYVDRDKPNASTSISVLTGNVSLEPSTSQDLEKINGNARFTWNLLDFGVSYLQAKQDADRYLIAGKAREKIMLTLLKEVRSAYWQAVAMEQMRSELDEITREVDEMLSYWQSVREQRLRAPVAVLMDIRALVETRQQLDSIRRAINTAQARLGNLINARDLRILKLPELNELPELDDAAQDVEAMELVALSNSADYLNEVYKVRIDQLETRKAMLRLLPGLEFSYGSSYDDNSFLVNSTWNEFGLNLTGDISRLFFVKRIRKFRESSEELTIGRKLAMNMAVVTGVHVTWQDYQNSLTRLRRAEYLQVIDEQISDLTSNAAVNTKESGAAAIQTKLRAFRSKIGRMQSYADAQTAYGDYMVSLGVNPIPEDFHRLSVDELAEILSDNLDTLMFPYTLEGERIIAERNKVDSWIEQKQNEQIAFQEEAPAQSLLEEADNSSPEPDDAGQLNSEPAIVMASRETFQSGPLSPPEQTGSSGEEPDHHSGTVQSDRRKGGELVPEDRAIHVSSLAPDAGEFLQDFLHKYFPRPSLDEYLRQFLHAR